MKGTTAIVTGGSRGIGAACCRAFSKAGANVVVPYHEDRLAAETVCKEIEGAGGSALTIQADLRNEADIERLFSQSIERFGSIQTLVTSAGIWERSPIDQLTAEAIEDTLRINLIATALCCREASRGFSEEGGSIVTISSTAAQRGEPFHAHYAASKGGVQSLTKSLARELGPRVRVNCVAPGWVETDMTRAALADPSVRARIVAEIPLRRIALPEDIAEAVLFLASNRARHITGEILNVNGGSVVCG